MPRGLFFARPGVAPDPEDLAQHLWSVVRAASVQKAAVAFAQRPWVVCGDVVTVGMLTVSFMCARSSATMRG